MRELVVIEKVGRCSRCYMFNEGWSDWEIFEKNIEEVIAETIAESANPNNYGEYLIRNRYYSKESGEFLGDSASIKIANGVIFD